MDSVMKTLTNQLSGDAIKSISSQLGVKEKTAQSAVPQALSLLMGALANNASKKEGAQSLNQALEKDHDGTILNDLSGFLGNFQSGPGEGILKHVLGSKLGVAEEQMGKSTGLDSGTVGKLLMMLAPVVLGALGKTKKENGLDVSALAGLLSSEKKVAAKTAPQSMSILTQFLDADGDGDIKDDIAQKGIGFLGKLLSKKRR
ncbi:MAG TPA: DUF937 domain-containing protein [Firmicutes bacterium]|nr:DUF937 domain-containing protein [Bacillota bacterium]